MQSARIGEVYCHIACPDAVWRLPHYSIKQDNISQQSYMIQEYTHGRRIDEP